MMHGTFKFTSFLLLITVFLISGCVVTAQPGTVQRAKSPCHIIYDAGSSGTRLYVYEKVGARWLEHTGPSSPALADPVRSNRGKTPADTAAVVNEVVASLDAIRRAGPANGQGKPAWQAFDWRTQCKVEAVSVLATAGMRIAEKQNPEASKELWELLNQALSEEAGIMVTSRSISGFEEGLFAWIAQHELQPAKDFGVVEMGGGSFQISFPCPQCKTSRQVLIKDQQLPMYSYSFSGWGQDEVWARLGRLPACEQGAGKNDPRWQEADCAAGFSTFAQFASQTRANMRLANISQWYAGGAFRYMDEDDIERFCRQGEDSAYQPESACFRAVYLRYALDALGLDDEVAITDSDWTLGAVICTATRCLGNE